VKSRGTLEFWQLYRTLPPEIQRATRKAHAIFLENPAHAGLRLDLEATFAAPDFYAKPRSEIFELETQLKTARDKVAHLYARWHELELLQSVPFP